MRPESLLGATRQPQRPLTPGVVAPGSVDGIPPKWDPDSIAARLRALPCGARAYQMSLLPQTWRPEIQARLQGQVSKARPFSPKGHGHERSIGGVSSSGGSEPSAASWQGEYSKRPSSAPAGGAAWGAASRAPGDLGEYCAAVEGGVEGMRHAAAMALDEEAQAYNRRVDEALFWRARNMESRIAPNLPMWPMGFMKNSTYKDDYRNHKLTAEAWRTVRSSDPRLRADSRFVPTSII